MKDEDLKQALKSAWAANEPGNRPTFEESFAGAATRLKRQRKHWRLAVAAAAIAVITVTALIWPLRQVAVTDPAADELLIADALMNSTSWQAPSDALMPERQFDIYRDLPFGEVSTELQEGSLL